MPTINTGLFTLRLKTRLAETKLSQVSRLWYLLFTELPNKEFINKEIQLRVTAS